MSDVSGGVGWWQASDGKWYRPEQHPDYRPPPPPPPPPSPSPTAPPIMAPPPTAPPPLAPQLPTRTAPTTPSGPPISSHRTKAKRGRRGIVVLILLIVLIIAIVAGVSQKSSPPASHASKVAALGSFVGAIRTDLGTCTAAASDLQVELGLLVQNSASVTQSDLATLDTESKNAQTACDETDDNAILNLGTMSVPGALSGFSALQNVPIDANTWATNDTTAVLHDVQNIAESNGSSVANQSKLQTDVTQADQDANTLRSQVSSAAQSLGIASPSMGLVLWSSGSSNTGSTGSTGSTGNTGNTGNT
jgi:hypothetical protein